jgi:hypothetical protein
VWMSNFTRGSDLHPPREYVGVGWVSYLTRELSAGIRIFKPSIILLFLPNSSAHGPPKLLNYGTLAYIHP